MRAYGETYTHLSQAGLIMLSRSLTCRPSLRYLPPPSSVDRGSAHAACAGNAGALASASSLPPWTKTERTASIKACARFSRWLLHKAVCENPGYALAVTVAEGARNAEAEQGGLTEAPTLVADVARLRRDSLRAIELRVFGPLPPKDARRPSCSVGSTAVLDATAADDCGRRACDIDSSGCKRAEDHESGDLQQARCCSAFEPCTVRRWEEHDRCEDALENDSQRLDPEITLTVPNQGLDARERPRGEQQSPREVRRTLADFGDSENRR